MPDAGQMKPLSIDTHMTLDLILKGHRARSEGLLSTSKGLDGRSWIAAMCICRCTTLRPRWIQGDSFGLERQSMMAKHDEAQANFLAST